jgi:hypothetical protein
MGIDEMPVRNKIDIFFFKTAYVKSGAAVFPSLAA